ncbi:MAG: hypothetical protein GY732_14385, partial [Gammaproteobacteria bacterium]|nr:hypothetical protein [Gammaproteobacteria bacterium]
MFTSQLKSGTEGRASSVIDGALSFISSVSETVNSDRNSIFSINRRRGANRLGVCLLLLCGIFGVQAVYADPDLPGAAENIETIPAGSLVVPMDTVHQSTASGFNFFAYGLANKFLQNEIPVKWAIRYDKAKLQGVAEATSNTTTLVDSGGDFVNKGVEVGDLLTNVDDGYATGEVTSVTATTLGIKDYTGANIAVGDAYVLDGYDFGASTSTTTPVTVAYTRSPATFLQVTDKMKAEKKKFEDKNNPKTAFAGFSVGDIVSVTGFSDANNNVTNVEITQQEAKKIEVDIPYDMAKEDNVEGVTVTRAAQTITVSSGAKTITVSPGDFIAAGFEVGDEVTITGFSNSGNNVTDAIITGITSQVLTFAGETLVTEVASNSVTFQTEKYLPGNNKFYAGPFIVSNSNPADVTAALIIIDSFNTNVATDEVTVFSLLADKAIDVRYTLLHKPFVAVSDENSEIHTKVLDAAGIPGNGKNAADNCPMPSEPGFDENTCNYAIVPPRELAGACATLHMEPHRDKPKTEDPDVIAIQSSVEDFVKAGGNFIAQCHAVRYFENTNFSPPDSTYKGTYLTDEGIIDADIETNPYNYPNSPMAFSQMTGPIDGEQGGSLQSWTLNSGAYINDGYDNLVHDTALVGGNPVLKASSGKLLTGAYSGGNIFYLGGHEYNGANLASNNGVRMALNTLFVPADRPRDCGLNFDEPELTIEKATNGSDADTPTGPIIAVGGTVNWSYVVTNSGNTDVDNITVSDSPAATITCPTSGNATIALLEPWDSETCTASGTATAGQFANVATATGDSPSGTDDVTDTDPSHYFGSNPIITIEKSTNGMNADVAPGPTIAVGGTVTWSYVVQNTGNVTLTSVSASDDKEGALTCPKSTLTAGESMTCTSKTGTASAGQYTNVASTTGTPPVGSAVTDTDPSNYFGSTTAITIEKATNGSDADSAPGPYIAVGGGVTWSYVVKNTGNVPLTSVSASDDKEGALTCPKSTLTAGESMICTSKTGTASAGQYENTASTTGTPAVGSAVTGTDLSHYYGSLPSITIEKATNGSDADTAPGPYIEVGDTVTWSYVVQNTGNVTLTSVSANDDKAGAITCPKSTLTAGESMTCTSKTGAATAGQYENTASTTGTPPVGSAVTNTDLSHYFGSNPSMTIEKTTNTLDADTAPGPTIAVGAGVTWAYVVKNTGNVTLTSVSASDDKEGALTCPKSTLTAGESMTCTNKTGTATAGQYENTASTTGTPPVGSAVTDTDLSHYFGSNPLITIEKATNTLDADSAPGPTIAVGGAVNWSYVVTNTGNTDVDNIDVSDSPAATITCPTSGNATIALLKPGESETCTASDTATAGQYANVATATGDSPSGTDDVTDTDPSHYFGSDPSIDITKTASPTTYGAAGVEITYSLVVKNTGNVTLTNVTITDPLSGLSAISCPSPETHPIVDIAPDETVTCSATYTTDAEDVTATKVDNTAKAVGSCTAGCPVEDTDDATVTLVEEGTPAIDIVKTASPLTFTKTGDGITYSFKVTNSGDVTLTSVDVTDPLTGLSAIDCNGVTTGIGNPIPEMEPGASVDCTATYTTDGDDVAAGKVDNTAKAEGECASEIQCPVDDTDDATVNAVLINLTKTVVADDPAYPTYDPVSGLYTVKYRITATNAGLASGIFNVVDDNFANLATGITLSGTPTVVYVPGDDSLDAANNPPGWPTIATAENIGAGNTESWDITANFTVDKDADLTNARACNEGNAASGTGFYNSVNTTANETDTTDNDACVDLPDPDLDLSKTITNVELTGVYTYRLTYLVRMDNEGDGPGGPYDIDDVTGFGAGVTLDGTPVVTYVPISDGASPVTSPGWTKIADDETIAGQKSESWQVVANVIVDPSDADYAANRECEGEGSSLVTGKGFYNKVNLSGGSEEDLTNNQDCDDVPDPKINLTKTVVDDHPPYPTYDPVSGLYTVKYRITAINTSSDPGAYNVVDDGFTNLATGISLSGIPTVVYVPVDDSLD